MFTFRKDRWLLVQHKDQSEHFSDSPKLLSWLTQASTSTKLFIEIIIFLCVTIGGHLDFKSFLFVCQISRGLQRGGFRGSLSFYQLLVSVSVMHVDFGKIWMEGKVDDAKKRKLNQEEREQHAQRKKNHWLHICFTALLSLQYLCFAPSWTFAVWNHVETVHVYHNYTCLGKPGVNTAFLCFTWSAVIANIFSTCWKNIQRKAGCKKGDIFYLLQWEQWLVILPHFHKK